MDEEAASAHRPAVAQRRRVAVAVAMRGKKKAWGKEEERGEKGEERRRKGERRRREPEAGEGGRRGRNEANTATIEMNQNKKRLSNGSGVWGRS